MAPKVCPFYGRHRDTDEASGKRAMSLRALVWSWPLSLAHRLAKASQSLEELGLLCQTLGPECLLLPQPACL